MGLDDRIGQGQAQTGALEGSYTDEDGTVALSIDPVTGVVTETENGETFLYESPAAFFADDED